jgi:predicted O-methyltransferase YrrM
MSTFQGISYRDASNWIGFVPEINGPIRYLEIGVLCGYNVLSVERTYARHPDSVLVCVDPWIDYIEYPEYKGKITTYYDYFLQNTEHIQHKLEVYRDFSYDILRKLEDNSFDLIYIDGNHESRYVLEDAVMAFRKLKAGGWLVFDDYGHPDVTPSIDSFLKAYLKHIDKHIGYRNNQVFVHKLN